MTKVYIFKKGELICGYQVKGHSGYAEEGSDIVCSAISTATQMTLCGLKEIVKIEPQVSIRDGFMQVELNKQDCEIPGVQVLLKTMEKTIVDISNQYADYVKLEVKKDVY